MDTFSDRLNSLVQDRPISAVAKACDISNTAMQSYLKKGSIPAADKAARIAEFFDVDLEWLITGKESKRALPASVKTELGNAIAVPYYPDIYASAGFGNEAVEAESELLCLTADILPYKSKHFAVINVAGDSMEPTLQPEERVIVDMSVNNYARPGIYVLRWDGCLYVKRLEKEPMGPLHIISDNPSVPSWKIDMRPDSQLEITILGRVIMKFKNI
jgi:phage repressor protein C with HTH and peptisase S24 domain